MKASALFFSYFHVHWKAENVEEEQGQNGVLSRRLTPCVLLSSPTAGK